MLSSILECRSQSFISVEYGLCDFRFSTRDGIFDVLANNFEFFYNFYIRDGIFFTQRVTWHHYFFYVCSAFETDNEYQPLQMAML